MCVCFFLRLIIPLYMLIRSWLVMVLRSDYYMRKSLTAVLTACLICVDEWLGWSSVLKFSSLSLYNLLCVALHILVQLSPTLTTRYRMQNALHYNRMFKYAYITFKYIEMREVLCYRMWQGWWSQVVVDVIEYDLLMESLIVYFTICIDIYMM